HNATARSRINKGLVAKWHYFQGKKFFIGELYLFKPAWFSNCGEFAIIKIRIVNTLAQNKKNLCPERQRFLGYGETYWITSRRQRPDG
ncbi:MAG: hypothetical protein IKH37_06755, partial [Prevotella sp.]|nr:hypothetical protein [Prevotella sp.]